MSPFSSLIALFVLTLNNGDSFLASFEVLDVTVDVNDIASSIKTDKTLWCWGQNINGELGNAKGGVGLIIPGYLYITPNGRAVKYQARIEQRQCDLPLSHSG